MAALLRSQDALDLETAIREWQSRQNERQHGGPAPEPDEKSAVARLTAAVDTLFREIVVILSDKGKFPRDIFISLDRTRSCFSLWSDGHGVASGSLDDKFQRSRKLRQATMKTLSHLSSTLIDRLAPIAHVSNPKTEGLCDQVSNILEEVNFSNVPDDSSSDSTSEYSTADVHELAEDLKTDVDCLIELDQMIRDPVTDPEPEMTDADVSLSSWAPHQVFTNKIEHRFPEADIKLLSSLGMVNYQRYLRCRIERDRNQVHAEQPEQAVEVTTGSKFCDSGLGSSLNPASSCAETIMSYGDGSRSIRIPPLPEEAKRGEPFPCVACGRSVIMTTNSQWKRHLYFDLQPYVCLDTSCQRIDSTFSNRANWLQHLALDHGMEPKWEQIKCPLCGDDVGPGKIPITTHLGRHLEEISLSALPVAPDSETNSETNSETLPSDIDNNVWVDECSEEGLQDPEAEPVESEGELQEPRRILSHQIVDAHIYSIFKRPTRRQGNAAAPQRKHHYELQKPNDHRDLVPSEAPVDSWKTREDTVHAATKEAAGDGHGDGHGDEAPILSDYPASPSARPTSGDAVLVQYLEQGRDPDVQIHNGKEAAFHRRMGKMTSSHEAGKRGAEKARIEAEEAAYQRLKAEQKAEEEERARLYAQAIAAAEEAAYKRIKAERAEEDRLRAELNAMESRRRTEAEIRDRVEAEMRAKMLEIEEAHRHRMKDMKAAQEEAKKEIEKARVEAEKAARERLVAERKAEEERTRKHTEAMAAAEENARVRFEAELKLSKREAPKIRRLGSIARRFMDEERRRTSREASIEGQVDIESPQGQGGFWYGDQYFIANTRSESSQVLENSLARPARISDQQHRVLAIQAAEKESFAEAQTAEKRSLAKAQAAEKQSLTEAETTLFKIENKIKVIHEELKRDQSFYRWLWTCPSCGSETQDRRKGPVCSICSYLVGDGDGFVTYVPEPLRTTHFQRMTEEQLRQQHPVQPNRQAAFASLEAAPQTEHQDSSRHTEKSVPDSTTKNHKNALNDGAKGIPHELSFLEPSVGIDSHTAALKKKLNPVRLSTAANRPLSDLDLDDSLALPRIQLGNTTDIHNTIPSLNEDTDLVEGLRDHDRDWSLITDEAEQRRRANRMAQRAYRLKLKKRLEDLERRAGAADGQDSDQTGTSQDRPLNGIPIYPKQGELGRARDRNRYPDVDGETPYGSSHDTTPGHPVTTNPNHLWIREHGTEMRHRVPAENIQRQGDSKSLSTEPPSFQPDPGATITHTWRHSPSPPEADGSASHHTPMTDVRFDDSVRNDGDYLKKQSWPFPRPL